MTFHPSMAAPVGPVKFWRPGKALGGALGRCSGRPLSLAQRPVCPGSCGSARRPDLGGLAAAAKVLVGSAAPAPTVFLRGSGVRSQPRQKFSV